MAISPATSTLSRFPAAAADFVRDLYLEHLEEASFLYDQRNHLLEHIEAEARDIAWNEQRCDRHLDALVAGRDSTLAVCQKRAETCEDGGELYAAVRVFCRANRPDLVKTVLDKLKTEDAEMMRAVHDGLSPGLPRSWSTLVAEWLDGMEEACGALLCVASSYRELDVGPAVVMYASGPLDAPAPFLWALGRLGEPTAASLFRKHLHDGDRMSRQAAAIAALRCGDRAVTSLLRTAVDRGEAWPVVPLAIAGELSDFPALERLAAMEDPSVDLALGLGLLGHVGAVDILLRWVEADEVGQAAALALNLLTGLYPLEEASADSASNVELSVEDDAEYSDRGSEHRVLARSRATWEPAHAAAQQEFAQDARVQFGEPYSIARLVRGLATPRLPVRLRNLLGDVLLVRHNVNSRPCDDWNAVAQWETLGDGGRIA